MSKNAKPRKAPPAPRPNPPHHSGGDINSKPPVPQSLPKEAAAPKGEPEGWVYFVSVDEEPVSFDLSGYPAIRYGGDRLAWRVPAAEADKVERHHWLVQGRVIRTDKDLATLDNEVR